MLRILQNIKHIKHTGMGIALCCVLVCFCFLLPGQATAMDGAESRKLMAGLELFPSFLAADQQIQSKKDSEGGLQLVILYTTDRRTAEKMASRLRQIGKIKAIPIHTTVIQASTFNQSDLQPAGIFISQENIADLNAIVEYGESHSIITFSPFTDDLKMGITGSISITARIRPQINMNTLKSSKLVIKPFFLRISKQYSR